MSENMRFEYVAPRMDLIDIAKFSAMGTDPEQEVISGVKIEVVPEEEWL